MKKLVVRLLLATAVGILLGHLLHVVLPYKQEVIVEKKVDTMYVYKTVTIEKPVLKDTKVVEKMLVPVHDTIVKNDTTYIALPRESKTYGDERYTAVVSGYKPSLDRLDIYIESQTVTKYLIPEPTKPKMNFLSAGLEAEYMKEFSLPIYLEYERRLHENFSIYVKGEYDLMHKTPGVLGGVRTTIGW